MSTHIGNFLFICQCAYKKARSPQEFEARKLLTAEHMQSQICRRMAEAPDWLPGIELRADGYECPYYQKQ